MPFLVWVWTRGLKSIMKTEEGQHIWEIFQKEIIKILKWLLPHSKILYSGGICWQAGLGSLERKQTYQIFPASTFFLIEWGINAVRFYLSCPSLASPVCLYEWDLFVLKLLWGILVSLRVTGRILHSLDAELEIEIQPVKQPAITVGSKIHHWIISFWL